MHLQCWPFYRWSQKYGHVPSRCYHLVSCGQLSVFTSGIKQCIFRRYLSVSFRRTYYGHILSHRHNILIIHQIISHISIFVTCSHMILFTIFCVYSTYWHHGSSIGEGYHKHNILIIHQIISHISIFVNCSHIILFTIFCVYSTYWYHGQGYW